MSRWPDGPTRLVGRRCAGCWYQGPCTADTAVMTKEALNRELYVTCHRVPGAVCAGFYELFSTAALRMVHMLWGFTTVDPPRRQEALRMQALTDAAYQAAHPAAPQ